MSIESENIQVNQDVQEHYIIYDREITPNPDPEFNNNILVTWDNKSNRLYFNMYYTFDDRTLRDKEISVVWINANGDKGMTPCGDITLDDDRLYFSWNVPIEATYCAGIINFAVHITTDNYIWNSLAGQVEVKRGLITEEFNNLEEAKLEPGWVDYIEGKYKLYLVKISQSDFENLDEKDDNALYLVEQVNGTINQYLGDCLISINNNSNKGILGNYADTSNEHNILVVGNGTSELNKKNAIEISDTGNMLVSGTVSITDISTDTVIDLLAKIKDLERRISELETR